MADAIKYEDLGAGTPASPRLDIEHIKVPKLLVLNYRVPQFNDLYIDKNKKVNRCKEHNQSKRAQKRVIVLEVWDD